MCGVESLVLFRHYIFFFFFNDTATTEIYTLSLHDALPILDSHLERLGEVFTCMEAAGLKLKPEKCELFAKRVRSEEHTSELQSHVRISYAVFCLKKKK